LPRNGCGGGGSWLPGIVVVASGEPGAPVVCCAIAGTIVNTANMAESKSEDIFIAVLPDRAGHTHRGIRQRTLQ
jgi:hypothetical protein